MTTKNDILMVTFENFKFEIQLCMERLFYLKSYNSELMLLNKHILAMLFYIVYLNNNCSHFISEM